MEHGYGYGYGSYQQSAPHTPCVGTVQVSRGVDVYQRMEVAALMAELDCVNPDSEQTRAGTETLTGNGQTRFVNRQTPLQFLIYTDGACGDNDYSGATAGWAFVYGPCINSDPARGHSIVGGRLEPRGPYGGSYPQTSNRAELRAVIAALNYRPWAHEGAVPGPLFDTLVIATDSTLVARGATEWAPGWISRGWRKANGDDVVNKDLWMCLLGQIERLYDQTGMRVEFWWIPRRWNGIADAAAKIAAEKRIREDGIFLNWVSREA